MARDIEAARETCAAFDRQFGHGSVRREALLVWASCVFFVGLLLGVAMIGGGS